MFLQILSLEFARVNGRRCDKWLAVQGRFCIKRPTSQRRHEGRLDTATWLTQLCLLLSDPILEDLPHPLHPLALQQTIQISPPVLSSLDGLSSLVRNLLYATLELMNQVS